MAYSELIKNFERIRDYMREFYVYGFKSREEYQAKSARSYDNERRRVESWLGDYMCFHQDASGKNIFLSVDSRRIPHNPLYQAFKAKSFTAKDITLHFYILDLLADGGMYSGKQMINAIHDRYLSQFSDSFSLDESTVRKKLKEYEGLGLLISEKRGRETYYRRTDIPSFDLNSWSDALDFFSEADSLGVIGSFLLDKLPPHVDAFRFKHHYMLRALDSDILCRLLEAIDGRRMVTLTMNSLRSGRPYERTVCPLKIYVSTQSGRQYLLGYHYHSRRMLFLRLDAIKEISVGEPEPYYDRYLDLQAKFDQNLWGVSTGLEPSLEHIEMIIRIGPDEAFIRQRLEREKRHGTVEYLDRHLCKFTADVYDAAEMLPWLRTFIGRIVHLTCSNPFVLHTFYEDLRRMAAMYGGGDDAVQ